MKQPPSFQAVPAQGPDFDPIDWIVQNLENIEGFLSRLALTKDKQYLHSHLSSILNLRHTLSSEIDKLSDEPYLFSVEKLKRMHKEVENIFIYVEGVVGALEPWNEEKFQKALIAAEDALSKLDKDLTL